MAIYQGDRKVSGSGIAVDSIISSDSENPVQNKAVADALSEVGYSEWQKPADWIDIRTGAVPNSVYFLVGHSADYSKYPTFRVSASISNSGSYDVYVDGIKQATTASGTTTELAWQTLALDSGFDVTYPEALRTHVVRITPTVSTNTITAVKDDTSNTDGRLHGLLWAHFNINNTISLASAFQWSIFLLAVTAVGDVLRVSNLSYAFTHASVYTLPTFTGTDVRISDFIHPSASYQRWPVLKKMKFKDFIANSNSWHCFNISSSRQNDALKEIIGDNATFKAHNAMFAGHLGLKKVTVSLDFSSSDTAAEVFKNCTSLEPFALDASAGSNLTRLGIGGSSDYPVSGLKALTVSPEAPFSHTTSPQLEVAYTGLERSALVNLFKSMPTVSAGQICNITGATGAADLTAEDLAIAVNKGWTVMR